MYLDPEQCPTIKKLKQHIPSTLIWTESNLDENTTLTIGETLSFKCPNGLKISQDNDSYNEWDDLYTIGE